MNHSLRFIRSMKYKKYDLAVTEADFRQQAQLRTQLEAWKVAFDRLLNANNPCVTAKDIHATNVLDIHRIVCLSWLVNCTSRAESASDAFIPEYETAVSLAEMMQDTAGTREQRSTFPSTFLFDMEVVSPLYLIGIKCRHPQIRRRAIAHLRSSVRREGLWDSNMAAAIAERTMLIEEAGLSTLDGTELPEESARVHNAYIFSQPGLNPNRHKVTFHTKPNGLEGYWKIWQEEIVLESSVLNHGIVALHTPGYTTGAVA